MRSAHGIRKDRPCAVPSFRLSCGMCYVVVDAIKRAVPITQNNKKEKSKPLRTYSGTVL